MTAQALQTFLKDRGYLKDNSVLAQQVGILNQCLEDSSAAAIEAAKSLLETVCKTILGERGDEVGSAAPSAMDLVKATLKALHINEEDNGDEVGKIIKALTTVLQEVSSLRNQTCIVSHGRDNQEDISFRYFDDFVVNVISQVSLMLIKTHHGVEVDWKNTRRPYEPELKINAEIDKAVYSHIDSDSGFPNLENELVGKIEARPSEVLYYLDRDAWLTLKNEIDGEGTKTVDDEEGTTEKVVGVKKVAVGKKPAKPKKVVGQKKAVVPEKVVGVKKIAEPKKQRVKKKKVKY